MNKLIPIDVFYRDILVVFGDEKTLRKSLLKYHCKEEIENLVNEVNFSNKGSVVYDSYNKAFFLWMPDKPKTAQDVGFLMHEVFHATCAVMSAIGITLSDNSEEVYAYLIGFLTEKILDKLSISFSCGQELVSKQKQQLTSPLEGSLDSSEAQMQ